MRRVPLMPMEQPAKYKHGVTWRAIIIGLLLIPINSYWVFLVEIVRYAGHPTTISLFYNAIFNLFILIGINRLLARWAPKWTFSQGELLTVYIMINISSALVGHDFIQVLVPIMTYPFKYASPENQWRDLVFSDIPKWLSVRDTDAVNAFYHGASSIYDAHNFRAWLRPVLWWSGFTITLVMTLLFINVLLRKQWTEREKLTYPLVHLPLDMTAENSPLWRSRLLWLGFALAAVIDINNGLHMLYPSIPAVPIKLEDQSSFFTARPWNNIGWLPVDFYPFGIGLGMLLPLDLLFSCWFFFWVWKAQLIISAQYGWNAIPSFPFIYEQAFGAYMGICLFAFLMSRAHLWNLARHFFRRRPDIGDENEPISYRAAMWGTLAGLVFLFCFACKAGLSPWVVVVFFAVFFALMLAITRMRAELGPPAHDLHMSGPDRMITSVVGPGNMARSDLTVLSMFYWFNRAYRCHPTPFQLEGFKMGERARMSYSRLFWAMTLATVIGTFAAFWANLHHLYIQGGAVVGPPAVPLIFGMEPYNRLDGWIKAPLPPDYRVLAASGVGFTITIVLNSLRMRLPWLPLHPVGYAVSSSWSMHRLWISMFIAWLIKLLLLRYGGLRAYRNALPFFLGIIIGECIIGGLWTMVGGLLGVPTYAFWP